VGAVKMLKVGLRSIPLYKDHFNGLCLKERRKGNERPWNQMERKTLLDLDYADDLSILDESVSKMNEISEVLGVQGAITISKINVKKTKSYRLGISGDVG